MDTILIELYKMIKYKKGLNKNNGKVFIKNFSQKITNPKRVWIPTTLDDIISDALYLYATSCSNNLIYNKYNNTNTEINIFNDILQLMQNIDSSSNTFFYTIHKNIFITIEKTNKQINIFYSSIYETINDFRKNLFICSKFIELIAKYCKLSIGYINVNIANLEITGITAPTVHKNFIISNSFRFASLIKRDTILLSSIERGLYNCTANDINIKYKKFLNSKNIFSSKNLNYLISVIYYLNCKRLNCFDTEAKQLFTESTFPELLDFAKVELEI